MKYYFDGLSVEPCGTSTMSRVKGGFGSHTLLVLVFVRVSAHNTMCASLAAAEYLQVLELWSPFLQLKVQSLT
jgi:hypothetical protein